MLPLSVKMDGSFIYSRYFYKADLQLSFLHFTQSGNLPSSRQALPLERDAAPAPPVSRRHLTSFLPVADHPRSRFHSQVHHEGKIMSKSQLEISRAISI